MTGQRLGQAGWLSPSEAAPKGVEAEAEFTSSSGSVRALSVHAKKELSDEGRLETVPNRVRQSGKVSSPGEWQLPRGYPVATVHQHGANDSGGLLTRGQPKERR